MIMFRNFCESKAAVTRLSTYSGSKATYVSTGDSVFGQLLPVESNQKTIALHIMGQAYEFRTDGYQDIQIKDYLTVDTVVYRVRGIKRETAGGLDVLTATLELSVKD